MPVKNREETIYPGRWNEFYEWLDSQVTIPDLLEDGHPLSFLDVMLQGANGFYIDLVYEKWMKERGYVE